MFGRSNRTKPLEGSLCLRFVVVADLAITHGIGIAGIVADIPVVVYGIGLLIIGLIGRAIAPKISAAIS